MAQFILFCSTQYIKDNTSMNNNVDSDIIESHLIQAQKLRIEPILGTSLYKKLESDISGSSVTGVYKVLLDEYVQICLANWVLYESLPFLNYKITNKSVVTKDSDNSTASSLDEIKYLRDGIRDASEYYSQRITNYLKANISSFPEYTSNSDLDEIRPNNTSYFGGLYLGDNENDCDLGVNEPK